MDSLINWLKKTWGYIASFGIALFAVLFGIERVRRKGAEKERDEAEARAGTALTEKKTAEKAAESVADVSRRLQETDDREREMRKKADEGDIDYNGIVDAFNSHEL